MAVTINGSTGIEYDDNVKLIMGTSDDLELYHSGSHSYIKNTGTGNLYIEDAGIVRINTDSFAVQKNDGSESILTGTADGAVELYYDNSLKCQTYSDGLNFPDVGVCAFGGSNDLRLYHYSNNNYIVAATTGQDIFFKTSASSSSDTSSMTIRSDGSITHPDDIKTKWGASDDLQIYHDGSNSYVKDTGTGSLCILGSEIQLTNAADSENLAVFKNDGACELFHDGVKVLETHANGIYLRGPEGGQASCYFYSDQGDDNADKWRWRNDNAGTMILDAKDSGSWITALQVSNSWVNINSREGNQGSAVLKLKKNDAASNVQSTMITFEVGDQGRGQIVAASADGGSPQFSSWSDRRLKTNFRTYTGGYDKIKAIPVKLYDEVRTGQKDRVGWIADEFQTVFPEAVQGTKDAVDSDNNPVYQTLAAGTIFPDLVQALQAAITKIETLETKVAVLEAA